MSHPHGRCERQEILQLGAVHELHNEYGSLLLADTACFVGVKITEPLGAGSGITLHI